jgi:hypothetical protein
MLIPNSSAWNGIAWVNQANISLSPSVLSKDPEIAGNSQTLLVVATWEEGPVGSRDIYFSYNPSNGGGSWVLPTPPATHPDTSSFDERNPAVAVTRPHPVTGQEIHIVYEKERNDISEVWHAYTFDFGVTWTRSQISTPNVNAYNPACVYTEDHFGVPSGQPWGWAVQIVWEEFDVRSSFYVIKYAAWVYDPLMPPPPPRQERYSIFGPFPGVISITISPRGVSDCSKPEIASVDERGTPSYNVHQSVVYEIAASLPGGGVRKDTYYDDGIFTINSRSTTPPRFDTWGFTVGSFGQINVIGNQADAVEPDIAATQDYQTPETYFFHITYQFKMWSAQSPQQNSIESHYSVCGFPPTPGAASFTPTLPPQGPGPGLTAYDNPTVASRFIVPNPSVFETWIAWEDSTFTTTAPDIFYTYGAYTVGTGWTGWFLLPTPVPYTGTLGVENNPELWNRGDFLAPQPVVHLAFDDINPANPADITYIDP